MFKQLLVIDYTIKLFGALFNLIRVYEVVKDTSKTQQIIVLLSHLEIVKDVTKEILIVWGWG